MASTVHPDVRALVAADFARRHGTVPLRLHGSVLEVGAADSLSPAVLQELSFLTGRRVRLVKAAHEEIKHLLDELYGKAPDASASSVEDVPARRVIHQDLDLSAYSVVQQVDTLLRTAVARCASDIHVEPGEHALRVRYRLDGVLLTAATLPIRRKDAFVSRLKILAGLDIAEKRRPQDGRLRLQYDGTDVDLRVATLPTAFGEKVVLRVLDKSGLTLDLEALGLAGEGLAHVRRALAAPHGMLLVTGPTGSGKTTTLYAALSALATDAVNVLTAEDPVEYHLDGINQVHVRPDIGFGFAEALRAFLRQDPDVVMVGEIRDTETAEIATRAALTGHLVLSTLHTNDAVSSLSRLVDMGVAPFLIAASLRLVLAQRLVRRLCPDCKQEQTPDPALRRELALDDVGTFCAPVGCPACSGTGYRGRLAVFEVLAVGDALADAVATRADVQTLRRLARGQGTPTLREAALAHARVGTTSLEEVLRATAV